jgi:hypothetical protein
MASSPIDASDDLMDLAFTALDHGIASVEGGGPLIPFAMLIQRDQKILRRFVAEEISQGIEEAKRFVGSETGVTSYAIAYDTFLTIEGNKFDAIMVEAAEQGQDLGHLFAQRYLPTTPDQPFQVIGNATYLGRTEQLLT